MPGRQRNGWESFLKDCRSKRSLNRQLGPENCCSNEDRLLAWWKLQGA